MIDGRINSTRQLVRHSLREHQAAVKKVDDINVDDALSYFEMDNPLEAVEDGMKARGATGVRKKRDEAGYEKYTKQRIAEMMSSGEYEKLVSGTGRKIVSSLATLFTNKTQHWEYTKTDSGEVVAKEDLQTLDSLRRAGGYWRAMSNGDWISSAVQTGFVMTRYAGGQLMYDAVSPTCIRAQYQDTIIDNGEERGVCYRDIEDAYVVVVQLSANTDSSQGQPDKQQYVAYFGRSGDWPLGRCVTYAANAWDQWPNVKSKGTHVDWVNKSGEIANPLSDLADKTNDQYGVEYPLILLHGGITKTSNLLMPVSTTLYSVCLEIDVSMSNILRYSMKSALGNRFLTNENDNDIPHSLDGDVPLASGQAVTIGSLPIANAQGAMDNLKIIARSAAEGYGVPGYHIFSEVGAIPEAGIALYIRTQPLIEIRENRKYLNEGEVARQFQIEKALYRAHTNIDLLPGVIQTWDPGRWILPENPLDKGTRLKAALDGGAISYVRYVREMNELPTDRDAEEFITKMNEQNEAYKPPGQQKAPGLSGFGLQPRPGRGI